MMNMTAANALAAYEAVRHRLPDVKSDKPMPRRIDTLADIADEFDVFLLDAFGVLNIGERPIEGTPERVASLQAAGKRVLVVSNAASVPRSELAKKYVRLGYDFCEDDIVTSRMACIVGMTEMPTMKWGVMALRRETMEDFGDIDWVPLRDDPRTYLEVEGILLVGSGEWTTARQQLLQRALSEHPRPVLVANPDIVAPREIGFSVEPGFFAHQLADQTQVDPIFFGKPFRGIYQLALERLGDVDPARAIMVGDSLHTDVLGAHTAGIASVLISDFGLFAEHDETIAITESGIAPDYIASRP